MDTSDKDLLISNNKEIGELLLENENLIRNSGFNPPVNNYVVKKKDRIIIPARYVRTKKDFIEIYSLDKIFDSDEKVSNVAYAFQLSDLYNYIINRFKIFGSVETLLYKHAFINVISIIEALVTESANRVFSKCSNCRKGSTNKCNRFVKKEERNNMKSALDKFKEFEIINLDDKKISQIKEFYDLRNKIHIILSRENELKSKMFSVSLYNLAIEYMKEIDNQIVSNAVPLYDKCDDYIEKRN